MPRRGNGTTQRKDGTWQATYELPPGPDGKRRRGYAYGKTMAEAVAKRTAALADIEAGIVKAPGPEMQLGEWLDIWRKARANAKGWKPATVRNYEDVIDTYIRPRFGKVRLSKLTAENVREMLGSVRKDGKPISTSTQKRIWAILGSALQAAVDDKLIPQNVATSTTAQPARVTYDERPVLTIQEVKDILAELKDSKDWLYPLFQLSVSTGVRQGEALALRWSDVAWDLSEISIMGTMDRSERTTVALKTRTSRRTLKVGPEVIEALRWQQDRQERLGTSSPDGLAFTSDQRTPVYDSTVRRHWADICERLKIHRDDNGKPTMHWHDIRHSTAVLMLNAGVPAEVVAWRLGHSSLNMVVRTYGWTSTARYEDAAEAMTAVLS